MDGTTARLVVSPTASGWSVSGEIDAHTVHVLSDALQSVPAGDPLTIDVAGVGFIDSSGLRALINLAEDVADSGRSVLLARPSAPVARLLTMTGLDELFGTAAAGPAPAPDPLHPPSPLTVRRSFRSELASITAVRDFVRERAAQLPDGAAADLELAASELATNAFRHGTGDEFSVELQFDTTFVCVRVQSKFALHDGASEPTSWRRTQASGRTGRGLAIVDRISDELSFAVRDDTVEVTSRIAIA